jgi:hypothetical protein
MFEARATNSGMSSTAAELKKSYSHDIIEATCIERNVAGQLRIEAMVSGAKHC